jgi:Family of unknown function (DUF6326)
MTTEDTDARARLSWVWVFVLLNMIFADIFSFEQADFLKQLLAGQAGEIAITPAVLLLAAVVTAIPISMVVLSQVLPRRANRWANMIVSIGTIAYVWGGGDLTAPHYVLMAGLETLGCLYIAWFAWRWRDPRAHVPARDLVAG